MNKSKIKIKMLQAYKKIINIELFNKIVSFIIETTNDDCNDFIYKLKLKNIWFERILNNNIQEEYGFKYFGELLERYEQRIGTDIKDIRAISLALGYSKEIIKPEMIIGTQLVDFIKRIKNLSQNDMYLKSALYLYDKNKYANLFEDIVFQDFTKTEDIVFVLSLFDDIKQGFDILELQLNELLGNSKTISAIDNFSIYNWLINNLYSIIRSSRKQRVKLFKAIITLPTAFIKKDSRTYKVLLENGYSTEEISFLNYISIFYSSIPNTVRIGKSIVEEKIAIEFCKKFLDSKTFYSDALYNFIYKMFSYYYSFDIKCYGFTRIKEALIENINIKNPKIFIKFYGMLDKKLYSFNILDNKWNIVQETLSPVEYRELFDNYLSFNDFTKEQIYTRINKYNELTNTSYLTTFNVFSYGRNHIFSKLVINNIISLEDIFNKYLTYQKEKITDSTKKANMDIEHLRDFIRGINNRKAFEFIKYFLSIHSHTIKDLKKYSIPLDNLFNKYSYYYNSIGEIDIKRKFLSIEEERELFGWLESYIFYTTPDSYIDFVYSVLKDDYIKTILPKEDLRNLYLSLIKFDSNLKDNVTLREKYLTEDEIKQIEKEELEAKERERLLKLKVIETDVTNNFNNIENMNFKSIYEFCYSYRWNKDETSIACKLVKGYLDCHIEEHTFILEEMKYFNKICNLLIEKNEITPKEIKRYIFRYIKKGESISCKH